MIRRTLRTAALLLLVVALVDPSGAQEGGGATVALDRPAAAPGEEVVVTLSGFRSHNVTVSVCGNAAARDSTDCDLVTSEGMGLRQDVTQRAFVVQAPPMPCPCVVRAASRTQDEVAVALVDIIGHPTGEVVQSPSTPLVDLAMEVRRSDVDLVGQARQALGGPTIYEVEVELRNRSGMALDGVAVSATAARGGDQVGGADLPDVGILRPGERWTQRVEVEVPAPVIGELRFEAIAAGAGRAVTSGAAVRAVPWMLLLLVSVLVVDVGMITTRWVARARRSPSAGDAELAPT